MTYRGKVTRAGTIVLEGPEALRPGTEVSVRPIKTNGKPPKSAGTGRSTILRYAGKAKGLPRDASRNLDHYLYGHPKR